MIMMSLESLCLPYMTSARGLAGLDGGHIVHEGAGVEVDGQGGGAAAAARIINSFKYRHYTVVFGEVFPTSTKTVLSFDL